jgi:hypothetical protein
MRFGMLSETTLINYSTMLWVYLGIRLFLSLAFIIGIIYFGARLKRKTFTTATQPQKSKFVSLGIGWSPRKEERRITAERRGKQTVYIAGMTLSLILGVAIGYASRDHQLISRSHTYWDVAILEKYSDSSFRIQPARMQDGQWDFCAPAPFQKHDELRYITFEQKNGCKRLEYFQKLDARLGEKLNAAISTR